MLKRVAVATVFANGADVLLLDEPFGAVDYVTKRLLHEVLLTLWSEAETGARRTVVFVTHDVDEALDPRRPHPGDERRQDRRRPRGRGAAAAHDRYACSRPTWCATSTCC